MAGLGHALDLGRIFHRNENGNIDKNKSMKRRLSEVATDSSNHLIQGHDAATGTVVPPELSGNHGMNACDSQMAKSLVALTEQRDKAVNELRQVTLELQNTRTTLKSKVATLEKELNITRQESQSTITKLQEETAAKLATMEKEVHETNERADKEITEARATFEAASENLTKEANATMQAIHQSSNENIKRIQQERDRRIAEMQETINELQSIRQVESEQLMQESELMVASLRGEALKNVSDVQIKAENEISKIKMESAETITQLRLELSATKAEAVAALQNLQEEAFHNVSTIMEASSLKLAAVEKDRDEVVAKLNKLLNATKAKAASDISDIKEEAKKEIAKVKADASQEISQVKQEQDKTVASLTKKIQGLKKKLAKMEAEKTYMSSRHEEAREVRSCAVATATPSGRRWIQISYHPLFIYFPGLQSVLRWEKLYSERSYCNLTHVKEDMRAAISHATRLASEQAAVATEKALQASRRAADHAAVHLSVAAKHVSRVANDVAEKASIAAAPHVQKSRELYDQHLKQHVEKLREHHETYLLPVHKKYIVPAIPVVILYATKAKDSLQLLADRAFAALVVGLKKSCPLVLKQLRKMEKRSKYFVGLSPPVQQGCKNPEESVVSLLTALLVIFIVIFRLTVWRVAKGVIFVPFNIIWFFSPLRLLRRKTTKKSQEAKKPKSATNGAAGKISKKDQ